MSAHERERLSAWLDGELAPAERAEVEAHLAACAECTAALAEMGALDEAARALPVEAPSGYFETFAGRVRSRIEAESPARARSDPPPSRWRMPVWTWAAAAVLLLAVVTPLTLDRLARDAAPVRSSVAQVPKAALEPSETVAATKPSEVGFPAAPVSRAERDEVGPRDQDQALEVKQDVAREREVEDRADDSRVAFAAPPAPEPKRETAPGLGASSAGARKDDLADAPAPSVARANVSAADAAPTAAVVFEGEAQEEELPSVPESRHQAAMRDVQAPAAAPPAVTSPTKGRMAAPQAAEVQGGLSVEKKTVSEDTLAYARLTRDAPENANAWRERREEWRSFATAHPQSRHVDEARVRVIEAGIEAWRAGSDPKDLARARADADAYLERDDARQKDRVRRAFKTAPESPR